MATLEEALKRQWGNVIDQDNMDRVGDALRDILKEHGLGVALMVAHLHGLKIGHIPLERDNDGQPKSKQCEIIPKKGNDIAERFLYRQYQANLPPFPPWHGQTCRTDAD